MPDPVTTVAGAAVIAGSFALRGGEPASLKTLADETAEAFSDLRALSLDLASGLQL